MKNAYYSLPIVAALTAISLLGMGGAGFGATSGPDKIRPTLAVTSPTVNSSGTNAVITVKGKAKDNVAVACVFYRLDSGDWTLATTTNQWTNWTANVTLIPGLNTLQAYATDTSNNPSLTNTVKFTYVVNVPLAVQVSGQGTVNPNYNGKMLQIGKSYTMTATPKPGFAFTLWTGSLSTNKATLKFTMASDLTFTANFADVQRPVLAILSPKANAKVSTQGLTVTGKASDNVGVVSVFYQLNDSGWNQANTTNGYTNWTASVILPSGAYTIQAYAEDDAGNKSLTNRVKFTYSSGGPPSVGLAPDAISGLTAQVASPGQTAFTAAFGSGTFSQTMLPGTKLENNAVGTYTYQKLGSSNALLTIVDTAPPSRANHTSTVGLTFTGSNAATFATTNQDGTVNTGTISLAKAANTAPASISGKTFHSISAVDGTHYTTVFTGTTATTTSPSGQSSSGTYTYKQYSPVGGLCTITLTQPASDAGAVNYVIVTLSASNAGTYFQDIIAPGGAEQTDYGTIVP